MKMKTFGGIEKKYGNFDSAKILLQSFPYDGTSTWGKGSDKGFEAFLDAAENMELYDMETDSEVYREGIHILPEISDFTSPENMVQKAYKKTSELLTSLKFCTFFGGEHSISIGIIDAYTEKYKNLTVLQLDAHADLRKEYLGSKYNHACALHQANEKTHLIQVGIRSMDTCEKKYLKKENCYFAKDIIQNSNWMDESIAKMTEDVYITLDLDVLDPSIMPATGTPEPGGLDWYSITAYLKQVFKEKNVVGFDIVELAPIPGLKAPQFLVAKLYYKMLSYKFYAKNK